MSPHRVILAIAVMLVVGGVPRNGHAGTVLVTAQLDYVGAPGCPSADRFKEIVTAHLGYTPFQGNAQERVVVEIESNGGTLEGRIEWQNADTGSIGEQSFPSRTGNCMELVRGMAFALAVQIQLMATTEPPPSAAPPAASPRGDSRARGAPRERGSCSARGERSLARPSDLGGCRRIRRARALAKRRRTRSSVPDWPMVARRRRARRGNQRSHGDLSSGWRWLFSGGASGEPRGVRDTLSRERVCRRQDRRASCGRTGSRGRPAELGPRAASRPALGRLILPRPPRLDRRPRRRPCAAGSRYRYAGFDARLDDSTLRYAIRDGYRLPISVNNRARPVGRTALRHLNVEPGSSSLTQPRTEIQKSRSPGTDADRIIDMAMFKAKSKSSPSRKRDHWSWRSPSQFQPPWSIGRWPSACR